MHRIPDCVRFLALLVPAVVLLANGAAEAGIPSRMLADINPSAPDALSFPPQLLAVNDEVYFVASDGISGQELWKTDGTGPTTARVLDIHPGRNDALIEELTAVGDTVFFNADDGTSGKELWKSDGTAAGTTMVLDINAGAAGSNPRDFAVVDGMLYFVADDGTHGRELWKSDGTTLGTVLVKDINPGAPTSGVAVPTPFGADLLFFASDGSTGVELWKSDGTPPGTVLVKDIASGAASSFIVVFAARPVVSNGTMFFTADSGSTGFELWKSDGTPTGTVLVKDISTTVASSISSLTDVGGTLYFAADDGVNGKELWKSDGTPSGTVLVRDIHPVASSIPTNLTASGSLLYFTASDGASGKELWRSDGTLPGTVLVKDIRPGRDGAFSTLFPSPMTTNGEHLYFAANDGVTGLEPWRTDGTAAGTIPVADVRQGSKDSIPLLSGLTAADGNVYFAADDGQSGLELWATGPFDHFGHGCPGTGGFVPSLRLSGSASPGQDMTTEIDGTLGGVSTILFLGVNQLKQKVQGGCVLYFVPFDPVVFVMPGTGPGNGTVAFVSQIPPTAPPTSVFMQVFLLDAGSGPNHGYNATNAALFIID